MANALYTQSVTTRMEAPPRAKEEVDLGLSLPLTLQQCRRVITEDRACGTEMGTTLGDQALR